MLCSLPLLELRPQRLLIREYNNVPRRLGAGFREGGVQVAFGEVMNCFC
jgi:hypothetical protein